MTVILNHDTRIGAHIEIPVRRRITAAPRANHNIVAAVTHEQQRSDAFFPAAPTGRDEEKTVTPQKRMRQCAVRQPIERHVRRCRHFDQLNKEWVMFCHR